MRGEIRKACLHPVGSRTEDLWDGTYGLLERQEGGARVEIRAELTNHRGCSLQGGSTGRAQGRTYRWYLLRHLSAESQGFGQGRNVNYVWKTAWLLCVEWRARGAGGRPPVRGLSTMVQARQDGGLNSADGRGGGSPLTSSLQPCLVTSSLASF